MIVKKGECDMVLKNNDTITLSIPELAPAVKESFMALRTNLLFMKDTKMIAITSSLANEGKSVTSLHLALSFANAGKKTLLIDGDLRRSRLCKYLGIGKEYPGLSEFLSQQHEEKVFSTSIENLSLMLSGKCPPNPSELLIQDNFPAMMEKLREQYDYVFIDTPPVCSATDATIIARAVDGVLLVVRSDYVKRKVIEKSKRIITRNEGRVIGVALNRLDQHHAGYYGYYEDKDK